MSALQKIEHEPNASFASSPELSKAARKLAEVKTWRSLLPLVFDWLVIATAILCAELSAGFLGYVLAGVIIATRQHALLILAHEGVHYRLANNKTLNDFLSDVFAAYPIFLCTLGYRANHLVHHRETNTDKDPDWVRKIHLSDWQFPQGYLRLTRTLIFALLTGWYKIPMLFWAFSGLGRWQTWIDPKSRFVLFRKIAYYTVFGLLIYHYQLGTQIFFYWIVPYLFLFPLFERIRSIAEHFCLSHEHELNMTRNVLCSGFEGFLFGPHNVNYHLAHHLYPAVPQYNLPKLNQVLEEDSVYKETAHKNDGYFLGKKSLLKDIRTFKGLAK